MLDKLEIPENPIILSYNPSPHKEKQGGVVPVASARVREPHQIAYYGPILAKKKEDHKTMKVICRGFTGELMYLERSGQEEVWPCTVVTIYDLSIYNNEKQVKYSFTGVKMSEIKFLGGEVSFG